MTTAINKSLREVLDEAKNNDNLELVGIINVAWDACDAVDHICEWDEQTNQTILEVLCSEGFDAIADEFKDALELAYA